PDSSFSSLHPPPRSTLFPYTTLFRSPVPTLGRIQSGSPSAGWHLGCVKVSSSGCLAHLEDIVHLSEGIVSLFSQLPLRFEEEKPDRKSTRLNSSHSQISYAVFCLKKK